MVTSATRLPAVAKASATSFLTRAAAMELPFVERHPVVRPLARLVRLLRTWRGREMERAFLVSLNHNQLRDMGLTRVDALRESDKPFWRA
jgi:uncharacterized protein YjiS (DUF1127 family)